MPVRYAKKYLLARFKILAKEMQWDTGERYTRQPGGSLTANIGTVWIEHEQYAGWSVRQMTNAQGGETVIARCKSAAEMAAWLDGALHVKLGWRA